MSCSICSGWWGAQKLAERDPWTEAACLLAQVPRVHKCGVDQLHHGAGVFHMPLTFFALGKGSKSETGCACFACLIWALSSMA